MDSLLSTLDTMATPPSSMDVPQLTISPAATSLKAPESEIKAEEKKPEEKKPAKKRKSWGQELPIPKTNLPPRFVPKDDIHTRALLTDSKKTSKD